jgi:hypothetical protein
MGIVIPPPKTPLFAKEMEIQRPEHNTVTREKAKLRWIYGQLLEKKAPVALLYTMDALGVVNVKWEERLHERVKNMRGFSRLRSNDSTDFPAWVREMNDVLKQIVALFGQDKTNDALDAQIQRYNEHGSRMGYWTTDPRAEEIEQEFLKPGSTH